MKRWLCLLLLCPLLTGCSSESVSDRMYTQTIGLRGETPVHVYAEAFEGEETLCISGDSLSEAFRNGEVLAGGRMFIGHTELLCVEGSFTPAQAEELLFTQELSPVCKVLYTNVERYFRSAAGGETVHQLRMAEQNGLLPETDLVTVLQEWLGAGETALLPTDTLGMVFLHKDGTAAALSDAAVRGMYWLRKDGGDVNLTLRTEYGWETLSLLHSTRRKEQQDGTFSCTVTLYAEDASQDLQDAAREQVLADCKAAVQEMLAAHADVIGVEDLLGQFPEQPDLQIDVECRTQ